MKQEQEWDCPPRRRWRSHRTFKVYQPTGWDWPIRKKIIDIGWRVMITCLKTILISALTIMAFCASWFTVTVIKLY